MRILIVEDSVVIAEGLHNLLVEQGFVVDVFHSGEQASHVILTQKFDLLLLDLGLPDCEGLQILRSLRQKKSNLPVLIISARAALDERILGLNEGADDYLCKPFEPEEVVARVHALLRRASSRVSNIIEHGALTFDVINKAVTFYGNEVVLHRREVSVLECLLSNVERVVSKPKIVQRISSFDEELSETAIETYISRLRKKFSPDLNIRTVRGLGYMLEKPSRD
ncbi:response regulator transcription factor [Photobacterium sp. WH77]|uniref:response regulator transcription factor n=1 Tax=Photobacterium TaxID=657 RepID=UPI001C453442|nr:MULTISPECIES: response regulator transcription factor [Photobacterium]MBV7261049.1 response regulator transcription factor [Photobacterium sp. WH24]MCG2839000.1 response regulator transcription factor [Photobacterium sp. WH77]MCG2846648.1 response regulator transcription factor [Photobacterium sp. WH80]